MKITQKITAAALALTASVGAFATTPGSAADLATAIDFAAATGVILLVAGLSMNFRGIVKGIEFVVQWFGRLRF